MELCVCVHACVRVYMYDQCQHHHGCLIIFKFCTQFSYMLHSVLPLSYTSVKWQWISMDKICFAYRNHITLHIYLQDQVSTVIATAHQLILSQHLTKCISWHLLYRVFNLKLDCILTFIRRTQYGI